MFFLPQHVHCILSTHIEADIFILQIPDIALLYHRFFPEAVFTKRSSPGTFFHPLPLNSYLYDWVDTVHEYILDYRTDALIVEIKTLELFHLIKTSYSKDSLMDFFASVDENDYRFVLFVLQNYTSVKTVEELVCLSTYSLSGFEKQFRRIFGIAPYKWMLKQKTENIYKETYGTSKPLKLIAEEFGFTGLTQMGNFCRRHLGFSPKNIRAKYEK